MSNYWIAYMSRIGVFSENTKSDTEQIYTKMFPASVPFCRKLHPKII